MLPLIILIFVGVRISYLIWYRQNNICIRCKGIGGLNEYDQYLKINLKNIPCYCCNGKGKVHKNVSEFYNATKRAKKKKIEDTTFRAYLIDKLNSYRTELPLPLTLPENIFNRYIKNINKYNARITECETRLEMYHTIENQGFSNLYYLKIHQRALLEEQKLNQLSTSNNDANAFAIEMVRDAAFNQKIEFGFHLAPDYMELDEGIDPLLLKQLEAANQELKSLVG